MKLASAFCHSASSLCTFCLIWCCLLASMSKSQFKAKQLEGKSEAHYRRCVPPCKHYMSAGDTHSLCVVCLGTRHAESESEDVFLLAISSLKRVGDLQALSVAPTHLDVAPGMAKVFLYPRVGYTPKVPHVTPQHVILQAFSPPPFGEPDKQKLNCVCLVRALNRDL